MTEQEMLLKIIELQDQIIKLERMKKDFPAVHILDNNDIIPLPDLCDHEYPQVWFGIYPPPCVKCGKLSQSMSTFSKSTTGQEIIWKK